MTIAVPNLKEQNIEAMKLSDASIKKSENSIQNGSPFTENQTFSTSSEPSEGKEEVTEENLSNINKDIETIKPKIASSKRRHTISLGDGSDLKSLFSNSHSEHVPS